MNTQELVDVICYHSLNIVAISDMLTITGTDAIRLTIREPKSGDVVWVEVNRQWYHELQFKIRFTEGAPPIPIKKSLEEVFILLREEIAAHLRKMLDAPKVTFKNHLFASQ